MISVDYVLYNGEHYKKITKDNVSLVYKLIKKDYKQILKITQLKLPFNEKI